MLPDNAKLACWTPRLLDVVRIVAAVLLLEHGTQKLFAMPPPVMPQPAPYTLIWFAAVIEVVDGPAEWIGTTIEFELRTEGAFTLVHFSHRGWKEPSDGLRHCSTKWAVFLLSLKSLLETGTGAPEPNDTKIDNWN